MGKRDECLDYLAQISNTDGKVLEMKDRSYQGSWKKRGGVGAFMMLARKWDRIESRMESKNVNYDLFKAIKEDDRQETTLEDIRDLRRYLLLVEAEMLRQDPNNPAYVGVVDK